MSCLSVWLVLVVVCLVVCGSVRVTILVWFCGWLLSSCLRVSSLVSWLFVGSGSIPGVLCGVVRSGLERDL